MPTPHTHTRASARDLTAEREDLSKALYFEAQEGARMASADYTSHGTVAVITLNNPPVNALSVSVRKGLADGLEQAANSPSIVAVVLTGAGSTFCGGADVSEFGLPAMSA